MVDRYTDPEEFLNSANVETMMSANGIKPWHELGTVIDGKVTDAAEALRLAGLDWTVETQPVYVQMPDGTYVEVPRKRAVVRSTDQQFYNIVSDRWVPIQNTDSAGVFTQAARHRMIEFETAGSLREGARVWIQAKIMRDSFDIGGDEVIPYLTLWNGHDGMFAGKLFAGINRVVCENTLNAALAASDKVCGIRHTGDATGRLIEAAEEMLGLANKRLDEFEETAKQLVHVNMSTRAVAHFLRQLVPDPEEGKSPVRAQNTRAEIERLFAEGKGNARAGIRGTAWALVNGVWEYVDHHARKKASTEARVYSATFGTGEKLKQRAYVTLAQAA